jgi:hypothetical protein
VPPLLKSLTSFGRCRAGNIRAATRRIRITSRVYAIARAVRSASAQVCHDCPRTPAAPIGRECLNSLTFSLSALAGEAMTLSCLMCMFSRHPNPKARTSRRPRRRRHAFPQRRWRGSARLQPQPQEKTAGHCHKFQANNGRRRARVALNSS